MTVIPEPGAGEALLRVAATSFNPIDASLRAGYLRPVFPLTLPHVPGIDVAGVVTALGAGVDGVRVGDPVVAFLPMTENGAAAEFVIAPADVLASAPATIALPSAAALPVVGLTAWQALFELADLRAGQRILINGAGGGVGGFAVQLAKHAGAHVIATASSRSTETVRAEGADQVIDYTSVKVADAIQEPLDAVLNLVRASPEDLAGIVALIRPGGVIVSTATAAPEDQARGVRARPVFVRSDASQLASLVAKIDAGVLRVNVTGSYPLTDLAVVQEKGEAGAFNGKVLITLPADPASSARD